MYGVTTKILENGNLEHICDILINILNIGFINIAISLVSGFTVIDAIINKNPVITIIPKIGEAIMFEIINVKDTVLKWYIIIGIIIMLAYIETNAICFI